MVLYNNSDKGVTSVLTLEAFGQRIKALRTAQGLSQQQLADLIYVTRKTVGNWETGNRIPDLTMLSRLAECLGVETYELIDTLQGQDNPPSIIVVEDDPRALKGYLHLLGDTLPNAQVFGFQTGAEALGFAEANRVALVFLDADMPGEGGVELAKKLQKITPRTNIVFIAGDAEYAWEALAVRCSGYLLRPLTSDKILDEIEHLRYPARGLPWGPAPRIP